MRAKEFTPLIEFAGTPPNPQKPTTENPTQDKKDIMVLLGFKPSSEALAKVKALLQQEEPTPVQQTKTTQQQVKPASQIPQPQQAAVQTPQVPPQTPGVFESTELTEDALIDALVERVKSLDPSNPKDAAKITQIEAILEDDIIEPAISSIVTKKFNSFKDVIINDIKHALMSAANPIMEKIKFLTRCGNGLVDLQNTFETTPTGNIYSIINDPVFNNIKYRLGRIEYGTGGSKLGRMEALLTFIGSNVSKQGSGDLTFADGTEVEIKASSANDRGQTTGSVMVALGKDKATGQTAYGSNLEAGKIWTSKMQKLLPEVPMSLNSSSITKTINPQIAGNTKKIQYTVDTLKEIFHFIFKNADESAFLSLDSIASKAGIDPNKLIKAARQIEFDYYQKLIGHDAILFINATSGNYNFVGSGQELSNLLSSGGRGSNFYTTGILDMKGTYGNGLAKIFIN